MSGVINTRGIRTQDTPVYPIRDIWSMICAQRGEVPRPAPGTDQFPGMLSAVSRRGPLGPVALVGAVVLPVDLGLSSFPQ
jgi:hypothetical protein